MGADRNRKLATEKRCPTHLPQRRERHAGIGRLPALRKGEQTRRRTNFMSNHDRKLPSLARGTAET
jgi:hypothetical protein